MNNQRFERKKAAQPQPQKPERNHSIHPAHNIKQSEKAYQYHSSNKVKKLQTNKRQES